MLGGNLQSDPSMNYVYVIDSLFVCYMYEIFHNFTCLKHGIKLDFSCKLHGKKAWIMYETLRNIYEISYKNHAFIM